MRRTKAQALRVLKVERLGDLFKSFALCVTITWFAEVHHVK